MCFVFVVLCAGAPKSQPAVVLVKKVLEDGGMY